MDVFTKGITEFLHFWNLLLIWNLGAENPVQIPFKLGMPQDVVLSVALSNEKREVGSRIS
jgi:hypothetical protein